MKAYEMPVPYIYPATLLCDFYKLAHRKQYPKDTEVIYSTWTPRMTRLDGVDHAVAFGFQAFVKKYLLRYFWVNFFERKLKDIIDEYVRFVKHTLGDPNPETAHIEALHGLGYLPIRIRAVPEGTRVPIRCPMLTIENTKPEFFWVTNYLETLMSCELWHPTTTATIADRYRRILEFYADLTGGDMGAVQFQGHDFSMRGQTCLEAAMASGAGHLLSFVGTDTCPAISYVEEFYNADITKELIGTSIPATEHSVMEANGQDEVESFKYLITEVEPKGFVSVVSDTWNFWNILTYVVPALKDVIMARDGRVVIRPDSGDPVLIVCGDPKGATEEERKGAIELLWETFGGTYTSKGFRQLDPHIGCIYGDSISLDRCQEICKRLAAKGFASTNIVLGIGSYTYQFITRDTLGFALKTTFGIFGGKEKALFKDPITDKDRFKKSQKGMVAVVHDDMTNDLKYIDGLGVESRNQLFETDILRTIFLNGELLVDEDFRTIRARLAAERPVSSGSN